jgi:hypothetical protein
MAPQAQDFTYSQTNDETPVGSTNQGPKIFADNSIGLACAKNRCKISARLFMARSVSAGTQGAFPELGVDRLCHSPVGHCRP